MKSDLQIALTRRTTASAVGELMADIERSPRESLRVRRERINRQREARQQRTHAADTHTPTGLERPREGGEEQERFDSDWEIGNH